MSAVALTIAVYATQLAAGFVLLALLGRGSDLRPEERLSRALLLGPAALALELILCHYISVPFRLELVLPPWWILFFFLRRRVFAASVSRPAPPAWLFVLVAALLVASLAHGLIIPVHTGDELWNFATIARIFETSGSLAPAALSSAFDTGHVEYPPLIALNEALVFLASGDARAWAVMPFFAFAGLASWLLVIELCCRRLPRRVAGPLAAMFLLWPAGYGLSATGVADLRLIASILLVVAEVTRMLERESMSCGIAAAAGVAVCALTKNEGIAFTALAFPVLFVSMRRAGLSLPRSAATFLVSGTVALVWPFFLMTNGIEGLYESGITGESFLERLPRLGTVIRHMALLPFSRDEGGYLDWGVIWPVALCIAAAGLLRGRRRGTVAFVSALLLAHILLYVLAFTFTPSPLEWHLRTASARLFLHTYPLLLLLACTAAASLLTDART